MRDIIIDPQVSDTWKIQLTIAINFISSKDAEEERLLHSKSDSVQFMTHFSPNDIIDELFKTLLSRYQDNLETRMEGNEFVFDSVQLLDYRCHGINVRRGGSYITSPDWIKKKKATINTKNKDDKCFEYVVTVALNCGQMKSHPEGVLNRV